MRLAIQQFEGRVPRVSSRLLAPNQAQAAEDCDLQGGNLRPLNAPSFQRTAPPNQQTLFLDTTVSPAEFLTFANDVDVVRSPVSGDQFKRHYITGDGVPKVRGRTPAVEVYDLGLPKPTTPPSVDVVQQPATTWTRQWEFFYEEPDGTQVDRGTLTEGVEITESVPGKTYRAVGPFPKPTASAEASLVVWFEAFDQNGASLGQLYPTPSRFAASSDFILNGAKAEAEFDSSQFEISYATATSTTSGFFTISRSYVYTFVTSFGEEGPPSDPSVIVDVDPTQAAQLTDMDTSVPGNVNVVAKRIYRTVTGTTGNTEFQFVAEIDILTSSYLDSLPDLDTGEVLPSADWIAPPADLAGLVAVPGAFLAGFVGRDVYFSEVNQPHAWPLAHVLSVDYDIVGLGVSGNSVVVLTKGFPYLMTGSNPDTMVSARIPLNQACASKRSICDLGTAVLYVSPDGIVMIQDGGAALISEPYYDVEDWRPLQPTTMIADVHDRRMHIFGDGVNLIFDFEQNRSILVETTQTADAIYTDVETDRLYLIQGNSIVAWNEGEPLTYRWRSKDMLFKSAVYPAVGRVIADEYPVTFRVFADSSDTAIATLAINDDAAFRLPSIPRAKYWSIEVAATSAVHELAIASSMTRLNQR